MKRPLCILLFLASGLLGHQALAAPRVVASILPLQSLAAMLLDGLAEPELLLPANQSPHSFALTPSQMRTLKSAELLIWVGPELERPLARVLEGNTHIRQLQLMQAPELLQLEARAHGHEHEQEGAAQHEHGPEHIHDPEHLHDTDPHLWLSPANAQHILQRLVHELIALDPANRQIYEERAAAALNRLTTLDGELKTRLAPIQGRPYMVYHDAYGYFDQHYGLASLGAITLNPEQPLGVASVQRLGEQLKTGKALCLFVEPQFSPRLGKRLAEAAGVRLGQLDPIGVDLKPGKDAYPELLKRLANSLLDCLGQ